METVQIVLPGLTNVHGTIFGGMLMQLATVSACNGVFDRARRVQTV